MWVCPQALVASKRELEDQQRQRDIEARKREKREAEAHRQQLREQLARDKAERAAKNAALGIKPAPESSPAAPAPAPAPTSEKPKAESPAAEAAAAAAAAAAGFKRSYDEPELSLEEARDNLCALADTKLQAQSGRRHEDDAAVLVLAPNAFFRPTWLARLPVALLVPATCFGGRVAESPFLSCSDFLLPDLLVAPSPLHFFVLRPLHFPSYPLAPLHACSRSHTFRTKRFCLQPFLEVFGKLVANIVKSPTDAKFRKVRLSNPKLAEGLVHVPGARQYMRSIGAHSQGGIPLHAALKACNFTPRGRALRLHHLSHSKQALTRCPTFLALFSVLAGWKLVEQEFLELPLEIEAASQMNAVNELQQMARAVQESRRSAELEERKKEALLGESAVDDIHKPVSNSGVLPRVRKLHGGCTTRVQSNLCMCAILHDSCLHGCIIDQPAHLAGRVAPGEAESRAGRNQGAVG